MTIEKRLEKLELMGLLLKDDYHLEFKKLCKSNNLYLVTQIWWKFGLHGNKKYNLRLANRFWEYIYNNYKEGRLGNLYVSAHLKVMLETVKKLEKHVKK